jgi:UDP-glucose 4-epimerase
MATFLVTGAAGYIGSTVAKSLIESGHSVVGMDNLSTGRLEFVHNKVEFVRGDITDFELMRNLGKRVDGVIHIAGVKFAGESVLNPEHFYRVNVIGTLSAGIAALESKSKMIVFSSSCSVYGNVTEGLVTESFPLAPISPYGRSKLMAETMLRDLRQAHQLDVVSLRYFNVIGAITLGAFDFSKFNLFPNLCRSLQSGTKFQIFGDKLPTKDGTCVRDYVDVEDVARAHILVAEKMLEKKKLRTEYNLGSAQGTSVLEVVKTFEEVAQRPIPLEYSAHRRGDPIQITSSFESARCDFGWQPSVPLSKSIEAQLTEFYR